MTAARVDFSEFSQPHFEFQTYEPRENFDEVVTTTVLSWAYDEPLKIGGERTVDDETKIIEVRGIRRHFGYNEHLRIADRRTPSSH